MRTNEIEDTIMLVLEYGGPCTLDRLVETLPTYSWNQIFAAVDAMSRDGRLRLRHLDRFGIQVALRRQSFRPYRQAV